MADLTEDQRFYLEHELISDEQASNYNYDSITEIGDSTINDLESEGGLDSIVRSIREINDDIVASTRKTEYTRPKSSKTTEVADDFVRNFLVRMGMRKTLDSFQTEWYELMHKGLLPEHELQFVPDAYAKITQLSHELSEALRDSTRYKMAALKAKEAYQKLRKERDFHRMHHKRVKQEKDRMIADLKKLKQHYSDYEPALQHLKKRYQTAMKEKMLTRLERDKAVGQLQGLKTSAGGIRTVQEVSLHTCKRGDKIIVDSNGNGPTQRRIMEAKRKEEPMKPADRHPNDSKFPIDNGVNPDLIQKAPNSGHQTRTGGLHQNHSFQAHSHAVSSVCLHPRKQLLSTTGDDGTWKLWSIPAAELVMTGEGHSDWVSSSDFHPSGSRLATTSGDSTVKIWDFNQVQCLHTFTDHSQAVWSCKWHTCGDFLVTSSMDNTAKVWDLNSLRCRFTLRGHTDSVNSASFLPYTNTVLTSSADKTVSLWDARTGLCGQTFYGHTQSVNFCTYNSRCDMIASCDSYGTIKLWDLRNGSPITTVDCGPHPCNHLQFDPSGTILAIASNDSTIKMFNVSNAQIESLAGHEDAVQCLVFDKNGEFLVSCGSDLAVKIWS